MTILWLPYIEMLPCCVDADEQVPGVA